MKLQRQSVATRPCGQRKSIGGGFSVSDSVKSVLGIDGIGDSMKAKRYVKKTELRVTRAMMGEERLTAHFSGDLEQGVFHRYAKSPGELFPVIVGLCPFCGVIGLWVGLAVGGPSDAPSIYETSRGQATSKPAIMNCNCPGCGHKWTVEQGKITGA